MRSFLVAAAICLASTIATSAWARCAGKIYDVRLSIGAHATDENRSFTVNGCAKLIVRNARFVRSGRIAYLDLGVEGHCAKFSPSEEENSTAVCKVYTDFKQEVFAQITNDNGGKVKYIWSCRSC